MKILRVFFRLRILNFSFVIFFFNSLIFKFNLFKVIYFLFIFVDFIFNSKFLFCEWFLKFGDMNIFIFLDLLDIIKEICSKYMEF